MKIVHIVDKFAGWIWWIIAFSAFLTLDIRHAVLLRLLDNPRRLGTRTSYTFSTEHTGLAFLNMSFCHCYSVRSGLLYLLNPHVMPLYTGELVSAQ